MDLSSIKKGKKRFYIKTRDPYRALNILCNRLSDTLPECGLKVCESSSEFINLSYEVNLFEAKKRILILMDYDPDHIKVISELFDSSIEDLFFFIPKESLPKNKSSTKIRSCSHLISLNKADKDQCISLIRYIFNKNKLKYNDDVPMHIIEKLGLDDIKIENELTKIKYYYDRDIVITKKECDLIFSNNSLINYFDIIDAFFRRRFNIFFEKLDDINEYELIKLLFFIRGQVDKVYTACIYKEQGLKSDSISDLIGLPVFIINTKIMPVLSHFNKVKLLKMIDILNELDKKLRLTKYNKKSIFESYTIKAMKV